MELPTFKGGSLLAGVDLDDTRTLLDLTEKVDARRGASKVAERTRKPSTR